MTKEQKAYEEWAAKVKASDEWWTKKTQERGNALLKVIAAERDHKLGPAFAARDALRKARPVRVQGELRRMAKAVLALRDEEEGAMTEEADRLNRILIDAEDLFAEHFCASASVKLAEAELVFTKLNGNWRLCLKPQLDENLILLSSASLKIRAAAAHKLQDLWDACVAAEKQVSSDVHQAVGAGMNFLQNRRSEEV